MSLSRPFVLGLVCFLMALGSVRAETPGVAPATAEQEQKPKPAGPFAFADFSWLPGNAGASEKPLALGPFVGEFRLDAAYHYSFNHPQDDTIAGSSEAFRHGEFQITQIGIGGNLDYRGVQARLMTQFGLYSQTTPPNDASPARGQWKLADAYRYISEAYAGYHLNALSGINIQAGLFMSYGLWSYYNFDNWTYQLSFVASNTPWFFNGMRVQIFLSDKLKIEPWLVNGWQSYGRFNKAPNVGFQVMWRPNGWLSVVSNQCVGADALGHAGRVRFHSDENLMIKYRERPGAFLTRAAVSLSVDGGFESGDGATPALQHFLGFMIYNRLWLDQGRFGLTLGGGAITNPGRYLVLIPPVNGATGFTGTPYFPTDIGEHFKAWDMQVTADYSPSPFLTFRLEFGHRSADTPYFTGPGGITPPGGNQGAPGSIVADWAPDMVKTENRVTLALLVKM